MEIDARKHHVDADGGSIMIREMRAADLPVLEWEGAFTHYRLLYQLAYDRMLKGNAICWLADIPEQSVVGQVFVLLFSRGNRKIADGRNRARIHSFRVRPAHQNGGIGTRLMAHAETDLQARGFSSLSLMVAKDNPGGLRFYERIGYEKVGEDEGYWNYVDHLGNQRDVYEPSWIMRKSIGRAE